MEVSVHVDVPSVAGKHNGYFRLVAPGVGHFGPRVWLDVVSAPTAAPVSDISLPATSATDLKPSVDVPRLSKPGVEALPTAFPVRSSYVSSTPTSQAYAGPSTAGSYIARVPVPSLAQPQVKPASISEVQFPQSPVVASFGSDEVYPEQLAVLTSFGFDDIEKLRELVCVTPLLIYHNYL